MYEVLGSAMHTEYIITSFPLYSLWFKTDNPSFLNLQLFQTEVGIYHQHSEDISSFETYFPIKLKGH